jgi:hypothetical protein
MKIQGFVIAMFVLLAGSAEAEDYRSGFGFGISVPDVWLVLTQDEVAKNADLFLEDSETEFEAVPQKMRKVVYERVRSGQLEIFYRREGISGSFVDNVNIMLQPAELPASSEQLQGVCLILPGEFSRVFGRPIALDRCELREFVNRPALYLQFDGAIPGTTTLQYQLQRTVGETVVLTATAATANLPRMMGEFEEMVASIRLQ